jgi:uncharacterized small protein (DUF1192 family)
MDWDPPKTPSVRTITLGEDLSNMSVGELAERIVQLHSEISRAEAVATQKKQHASAADQLFGKPG